MSGENKTVAAEEAVKPVPLKKLPDLKALREERGLTTEDIFLKTRINATLLNAIENGEFHLLPSPVFARKFIQIYAETIGIDAGIILAHYQRHVDDTRTAPESVAAKARIDLEPTPSPARYAWYAVPVVAVIAIAAIMFAFLGKGTPSIPQPNVTAERQKQAVSPPAPAVPGQPLKAQDAAPVAPPAVAAPKESAPPPSVAGLDLRIEATEPTWLGITVDRNPPFQVTLKTGEKLSRTAREFFVIDVGNAAGVNITFLGKSLGPLGGKGQVVHLRLPRQ